MTPLTPTLAVLLLIAAPLSAGITANLAISEGGTPIGTLSLDLDPVKAPKATANFIGLASGVLPWSDIPNAQVRYNTPYYNGIKFHRVVQGFVSQVGSRNGIGTDGPGYLFPDQPEVSNGLTHTGPYVISMANSGVNTNGSQIFITAASANHLDGKHIVFGTVLPGSSQTLADYINNVPVIDADGPDNINGNSDDIDIPVTDLVIDSVTIDYNGISFDPTAQGLPALSQLNLSTIPTPGDTSISFPQPTRSSAQISYTNDLAIWNSGSQRYLDENDTPLATYPLPTEATDQTNTFFSGTLVTYDSSALWPSSMSDRTLVALTAVDPSVAFTFTFDATGITGTWDYPHPTTPLSGDITDSFHGPDGYGCRLIMILTGINYNRWDFHRIGFDSATPTLLNCRQSGRSTITNNPFASPLTLDGTSTLTR